MFTPKEKIDYIETATEITEWIERTYGYVVNKNSDNIKIRDDFAEQLERLKVGEMSCIQQVKNNFIDSGITRPPTPTTFIQELKICFNKSQKTLIQPIFVDKIKFIAEKIYSLKGDENKIRFIKMLHSKGKLRLKIKSIASLEIEKVLKRNNYTENEISELIGFN